MQTKEEIKELKRMGANLSNARTYHKGLSHLCKWMLGVSLALSIFFWIILFAAGLRQFSVYALITIIMFIIFFYLGIGLWPYALRGAIEVTRYRNKKGLTEEQLKVEYQKSMNMFFSNIPSKKD